MPLPLATSAGGTAMAMPDVCNTPAPPGPPIPVPYPNNGMLATASSVGMKVLVGSAPVIVESSKLPTSVGDQAGALGGLTSGVVGGPVSFKQYSAKVSAEGKKVVFLSATTGHNGDNPNAVGSVTVPSQARVLVEP
jgi:hypothetical protein